MKPLRVFNVYKYLHENVDNHIKNFTTASPVWGDVGDIVRLDPKIAWRIIERVKNEAD